MYLMFSCKIIKKRRNSQRFCPSFSRINSFIGAARFPLLLKDRTKLFSVQKRMFFIKNRCILFRNAYFSSEIAVFYSEIRISGQNFETFVKDARAKIRKCIFLLRTQERKSEIVSFC